MSVPTFLGLTIGHFMSFWGLLHLEAKRLHLEDLAEKASRPFNDAQDTCLLDSAMVGEIMSDKKLKNICVRQIQKCKAHAPGWQNGHGFSERKLGVY